jgi:hypothetical protein
MLPTDKELVLNAFQFSIGYQITIPFLFLGGNNFFYFIILFIFIPFAPRLHQILLVGEMTLALPTLPFQHNSSAIN